MHLGHKNDAPQRDTISVWPLPKESTPLLTVCARGAVTTNLADVSIHIHCRKEGKRGATTKEVGKK